MPDMDETRKGISRRGIMKRGAIVGGALVWAAPAVQSIGAKAAFAQTGSPGCSCCFTGFAGTSNGQEFGYFKANFTPAGCAAFCAGVQPFSILWVDFSTITPCVPDTAPCC